MIQLSTFMSLMIMEIILKKLKIMSEKIEFRDIDGVEICEGDEVLVT